jgi:hypothetical protein
MKMYECKLNITMGEANKKKSICFYLKNVTFCVVFSVACDVSNRWHFEVNRRLFGHFEKQGQFRILCNISFNPLLFPKSGLTVWGRRAQGKEGLSLTERHSWMQLLCSAVIQCHLPLVSYEYFYTFFYSHSFSALSSSSISNFSFSFTSVFSIFSSASISFLPLSPSFLVLTFLSPSLTSFFFFHCLFCCLFSSTFAYVFSSYLFYSLRFSKSQYIFLQIYIKMKERTCF